jgi:N-acetylmuramoyl-L-alanine amidase
MGLTIIVDAGHGGNHPVTGAYMTPKSDGKFYRFTDSSGRVITEIREGVVNRQIAESFIEKAEKAGFTCKRTYHPYEDIHRSLIAQRANKIAMDEAKKGNQTILLSFHSNAMGIQSQGNGNDANGFSVWTTKGLTESDTLATLWFEEHRKLAKDSINYRTDTTDKDVDWEENFTVLYYTSMPAVLVENLFFTNLKDAQKLLSPAYHLLSAEAALNAVKRYQAFKK